MNSSTSYMGEFAANFIRNFNADIFFFSSRGVTEDGWITNVSPDETHIRRVMYEHSKKGSSSAIKANVENPIVIIFVQLIR